MPPHSRLGGSQACHVSVRTAATPFLTFLCPSASTNPPSSTVRRYAARQRTSLESAKGLSHSGIEGLFFFALGQATSCHAKSTIGASSTHHGPSICLIGSRRHTSNLLSFPTSRRKSTFHNESDATRTQGIAPSYDESTSSANVAKHHESRRNLVEPDLRHLCPDHKPTIKERRQGGHTTGVVEVQEPVQHRWMGSNPSYRLRRRSDSKEDCFTSNPDEPHVSLIAQMKLIETVRELEKKLEKARSALHKALDRVPPVPPVLLPESSVPRPATPSEPKSQPVSLTKDDYLNLVDLYFYSHQSRFAPDSPDSSPTPLFLDDYSFKLSGDFLKHTQETYIEEDEEDSSILKHVEEQLMSRQLREVSTMQAFIDLLLDDTSSNRALFEVYRKFPDPGVAYLPSGVIRLFLQRMSTPSQRSERSMLRYLSLIDDMQRASLPITRAEWSSAIYLAGRSFARVTDSEIASAFRIWSEMEQDAGVQANHVTFNILFDIAVRAGKFVLGETVLKEMYARGLKLNRLGRVSLIYYHGLRGDGDGVRKSYRDFVEAGEIVDTLVLNCVMVSLINAQEPIAAEQIYERMKRLQERLGKGKREDGEEVLFMKYPPPGSNRLGNEMASNSLGRVLLHSSRLKTSLPVQHAELQNKMPLTPDVITFRNLISHHAGTSGDLDRLTVLMNDMVERFSLPFTTLTFQLLFRGFATHGGSKLESARWTNKRLELVWQACLAAIKETKAKAASHLQEDSFIAVPSMAEVEALAHDDKTGHLDRTSPSQPKARQSAWDAFMSDFTTVPGEPRRMPGQRYTDGFNSPFFPSGSDQRGSTDSAPGTELEDGYTLPAPEVTVISMPASKEIPEVRATKWLVIWLIRAYAQCTGSRLRVEEVWGTIRRVWKPANPKDRDAAVLALRQALRQCDIRRRQ